MGSEMCIRDSTSPQGLVLNANNEYLYQNNESLPQHRGADSRAAAKVAEVDREGAFGGPRPVSLASDGSGNLPMSRSSQSAIPVSAVNYLDNQGAEQLYLDFFCKFSSETDGFSMGADFSW